MLTVYKVTVEEDYEGFVFDVIIDGTSFSGIMHSKDAEKILGDKDGKFRDFVTDNKLGVLRKMLRLHNVEENERRVKVQKIHAAQDEILANLKKPRADSQSLIKYWEGKLDKLGEDGKMYTADTREGLHIRWEEKMEASP